MLTRRPLLRSTAATVVATFAGVAGLRGATCDLVIRGGRAIDPARRAIWPRSNCAAGELEFVGDERTPVHMSKLVAHASACAGTVVKGRA